MDDSWVIEEPATSVPISDVRSHLTCLYYDGEQCSSGANPIYWDGHHEDSYCVNVLVNGEAISMYAVDLSVSGLTSGDSVTCNNDPGGLAKTVFLSSGMNVVFSPWTVCS